MSNFFKTKIAGEQILDGAVKRQNLETSIVSDIDTLKQNDITTAGDISELQTDLTAEESARVAADAALGVRVDDVESDLAAEVTRAQAAEGQVLSDANSYTDTKVADLVNSAPAVLDTLKELSDALGGDENFAVTVANNIGEVAADLAAEETRAMGVEAGLASDIAAEETRALAAEGVLQSNINAEETRAMGVEAGLASDITDEETRALAAEGVLQSNINAEVTRAQNAETQLSNSISAEVTRATAAEVALQAEIDAEEVARAAAVSGLEADIAAEETRAMGVEAGLASDIADEETRAMAAESALGVRVDGVESDLSAEETRALAAESALGVRIDDVEGDLASEVTRAQGAEAGLSGRITVLEQDPTTKTYVDQQVAGLVDSAPAVLDTLRELAEAIGDDANFSTTISGMVGEVAADLASEVTRATAAEVALQAEIDDEEVARAAAVTGLEADIAAEETRALAAESELGVRIDGVETDLAAEETRALAAEGVIASDLAAEVTRATAAEVALAADVATEVSDRQAGDTALGLRIDGVESDLSQEVSDRQSADTALSSRISVLETDATTKSYVDQKFAEVVDNAPEVLDTLNELAQAIGDDPAFITNISASIDAVEADLASEVTRATAAEGVIASDLAAEVTRAQGVEAGLTSDIEGLDGRITTLEESAYVIREIPNGLINDVNTVYTIDATPTAGTEQVFLNGILQEAGASGDYTISGSTITFGVAPKAGYSLFVNYVTGAPTFNVGSGSSSGFSGDYNDLINKPSLFGGSYNDLTNKPTLFSGSYTELSDKPSLFSGDYNDLTNKPTIPSLTSVESRITSLEADATTKTYVDQKVADLVNSAPAVLDTLNELAAAINSDPSFATTVSNSIGAISARVTTLEGVSFATVATSGSYNDLTNKPTLSSFTTLTSPASGQYLQYNGSAWVNASLPVANGGTQGIVSSGDQVFNGRKLFFGGATIKAPWLSQVALYIQPYSASQTANLFEVQNSAGAAKTYITKDGTVIVNAIGNSTTYGLGVNHDLAGGTCLSLQHAGVSGRYLASFYNAAANMVGSISHDGSTTTYSTTSDYRLKENFAPLTGALSRLAGLPIYRFNFKENTSKVIDGCKAHEVAAVCPEAVIGEKDAVDSDGKIIPQGVDYTKLVPLLVAAVQELQAKVAALESK